MFGRRPSLTKADLRIIANQTEIMLALSTHPGTDRRVADRLLDAMEQTKLFLAGEMAIAPDR